MAWCGKQMQRESSHRVDSFQENCRVTIRFAMVLRKKRWIGAIGPRHLQRHPKIERQYQAIDSE